MVVFGKSFVNLDPRIPLLNQNIYRTWTHFHLCSRTSMEVNELKEGECAAPIWSNCLFFLLWNIFVVCSIFRLCFLCKGSLEEIIVELLGTILCRLSSSNIFLSLKSVVEGFRERLLLGSYIFAKASSDLVLSLKNSVKEVFFFLSRITRENTLAARHLETSSCPLSFRHRTSSSCDSSRISFLLAIFSRLCWNRS